ncbi:MAG TPA: GyrI-like domain-containing protein [Devosia sp.]|nr:GyrI-like domain-containing protein [Devosia sp.]
MGKIIERLDLRKQLEQYYTAAAAPAIIDVPAMQFLMIDGHGDPNTSPDYAAAVAALFSVSFTLKFGFQRGHTPIDYPVMPLEALWRADDPASFRNGDKSKWFWTVMIMQPDIVTKPLVEAAIAMASGKKPNAMLDHLQFATYKEGRSAQLLHIGPYSAEGPNIEALHAFIAAQGGRLTCRHHEIYLSDPRRTAPENLKTIIRQPFALRDEA